MLLNFPNPGICCAAPNNDQLTSVVITDLIARILVPMSASNVFFRGLTWRSMAKWGSTGGRQL